MSRYYAKLLSWVDGFVSTESLNDYMRLAGISIVIGILVGFLTVAVHDLYEYMHIISEYLHNVNEIFVILLPVSGITLAYWMVNKYATTKQSGGGSHRLLEAYHFEGGIMTPKDTLFEPLASTITIGTGGSAGFEGPSLLLGGGIGSLVAQRLNLETSEIQSFLISGAAAGVAAIFKAPLTGIMFALEIPYKRDITRKAFIPATLASISAYLVAANFLGTDTFFPLIPRFVIPSPWTLIHAFVIGILTAIVGAFFVKFFEAVKKVKESIVTHPLAIPVMGGLIVGVIGLFLPQILGVGYETVQEIITGKSNEWPIGLLFALMFFKILVTCVTLSSGGSGGVFVPSLYVGAVLGALYIRFIPVPDEQVLIVAAMASIIAAANKTLLTSVAFVAETAGPSSIIFTLVAAATSYFISGDISFYEHVQPIDEFTEDEEAMHVLYHYIKKLRNPEIFKEITVRDMMMADPVALPESMKVSEALKAVQGCRNREFPITRRSKVIGQMDLEDLVTSPKRSLQIGYLPMEQPVVLTQGDSLEHALEFFIESEVSCVWVVDSLEKMKLVGMLTEEDLRAKMLELM
jgi:CIC family chloride channel protein